MLTNLAYKRPVVEIDGEVYARGEYVSFASDTTFEGAITVDLFLRGGGQGHGGNVRMGDDFRYTGEGGSLGNTYSETPNTLVGSVDITIGAGAVSASEVLYVGSTIVADTGTAGGTTSITADGLSESATGGSTAGTGADYNTSTMTGTAYSFTSASPTNPGGGSYGRGGHQISNNPLPSYTSFDGQNGVVQFGVID